MDSRKPCQFGTSVLIPTYNRKEYLAACLASIEAQSVAVDEVIVIDDGSTDDTPSLIKRQAPHVRTIRQENRGKSAALNSALAAAKYPLIWIVDDDDIVHEDAHRHLSRLLKDNPDRGFAYGRHDRFEIDAETGRQRTLATGYWRNVSGDEFLTATLEDFFAHQPGMIVRKALYDRVGPFNENLNRSIDYEMLLRLARESLPVSKDRIVFHQRLHDGKRGRAAARFESGARDLKWIESDKAIFKTVYESWPLEAYLPRRRIAGAADRRRALLQRATVMARKKLWRLAVLDLFEASQIQGGPLTHAEKTTLRRAVLCKYGSRELLSDGHLSGEIDALSRSSRTGAEISYYLSRGLVFRTRESFQNGRFGEAAAYAMRLARWGGAALTYQRLRP